ncbi:MAG: acetate CoA-transferase subunit alpha [Peptostreptococcaceae bacterium]|nr:acetate CoA-transferase subunit alpha [Peptostreptococcaceae bacterium]
MKNKVVELSQAIDLVKDGMTIMVGGFLGAGSPEKLIDAIVAKGVKNITLIANDTGFVDRGVGKWVVNKQVKHAMASHVGTNKETGNQMNSGEMQVTLVPQGTLIERIRCAGAGLGGVLTPTGLGTIVEEGKQKVTVDGKEYLLETPLKADIALVYATIADKKGNLVHSKATKNFNPLIAMAADTVIVQADKIVEVGEIDPDDVHTPGAVVNYIVQG